MGIDIYAQWNGQSESEIKQQAEQVFSIDAGKYGYLREAYHGEPYATKVLVPELWHEDINPFDGVALPARILQERLGPTLSAAMLRQSKVYEEAQDGVHTKRICQSFKDFVTLCAKKEAETGEACRIVGWY